MEQHQKAAAEHRKRLEQEQKHRQFQDQQKRLKEIRSIGTRHQDADSLIQSIIGGEFNHLTVWGLTLWMSDSDVYLTYTDVRFIDIRF